MFDKKVIFKILIIILLLIIIITAILLISKTISKYESESQAQRDVDVAFWVIDNSYQTQRIIAEDLYPSDTPFEYTFSVSNNNGEKRVETEMEYEISIITTTNLPLNYAIEKNGESCSLTEEIFQDEYGTFYKKITIDSKNNNLKFGFKEDITEEFTLYVNFLKKYENETKYADLIEDIKLELTANQIINEEEGLL